MKKIFLLTLLLALFTAAHSQSGKPETLQSKENHMTASFPAVYDNIESILVYPNPVVDVLKISMKSSRADLATITLFNNIGKPVYEQKSNLEPGTNLLSIEAKKIGLYPGVYFLQLYTDNERVTRKIIVK